MGRGFALQVRERYGHQAKLRTMSINKGRTANIPVGDHFIFYLCTKWRSNGLPQLADLTRCLHHLKAQCTILGVQRLAIPRIGCHNDNLQWSDVSAEIEHVFQHSGIVIHVYELSDEVATQRNPTSQRGRAARPRPRLVIYRPPTLQEVEVALQESVDARKKRRKYRHTCNTPVCNHPSGTSASPKDGTPLSPKDGVPAASPDAAPASPKDGANDPARHPIHGDCLASVPLRRQTRSVTASRIRPGVEASDDIFLTPRALFQTDARESVGNVGTEKNKQKK